MTVRPMRLQLSRKKGFNLQALSLATNGLPAVNCARPSKWGNPFKVGTWVRPLGGLPVELKTREMAVTLFRINATDPQGGYVFRQNVRKELAGKNLGCWCPLPKPGEPDHCHASLLLELANSSEAP